jgi:hypothetical protein
VVVIPTVIAALIVAVVPAAAMFLRRSAAFSLGTALAV